MAKTKAASDLPVYRSKRDFKITSEPKGGGRRRAGRAPIFVVQKHDARRLHWDFRLEHDGVLWSWAVPKGPSADPADKRLAVHVEDHPLDYADFQGTIPEGQYGAGTVETWDRGTWEPLGDPARSLADGELKFILHGQRLNGGYVLVRLKPRPKERADNWLLIKEHDPNEQPEADAETLEREKPLKAGKPPARKSDSKPPAPKAAKPAAEMKRPVADPQTGRPPWPQTRSAGRTVRAQKIPPRQREAASRIGSSSRIVSDAEHNVHLTHPDRQLWPGITKQDLADYWTAVAEAALPEVANRPLAFVRCPDGIEGEHFFQKHKGPGFPAAIEYGEADGAPYLFIRDAQGLQACAQMSAIELHGWGAALDDPLHPDRVVFDLDPGDGVAFGEVVQAALDLRKRLEAQGLASFCRTTGGKGLHLVVPLEPAADWDTVKAFCRSFAEAQVKDEPNRFVSTVSKVEREGKILIDWLRNGLGATAVVSFSPRARPGAGVATRLRWQEVKPGLDPAAFTLRTVPERLRKQRADPWDGFETTKNALPDAPKPVRGKR
jgi:bifunctional non-homologous end joining protein LigD